MELPNPWDKYSGKKAYTATPKPVKFYVYISVDKSLSTGRYTIVADGSVSLGNEKFSASRRATVEEEDLVAAVAGRVQNKVAEILEQRVGG